MNTPQPLHRGDKVAIVATARKVSPKEMEPAIKLFTYWGYEVVIPEGLYAEENQFAGSDEHRTYLLQKLLDDESIKVIICARGGYGSVRIIDNINWDKFKQNPKWIVGYSDATVLHNHIQNKFQIPTIHGIMPINIPEDATTTYYPAIDSLKKTLEGAHYCYSGECGMGYRSGESCGIVVGGNLSILYSLCGSESDIDTSGKILLIEDLDEYLYHIDRMMQNLKRTGKLSQLKGIIVGALSDMHDNTIPFGKNAEEIVWSYIKEYDYPVIMGAQIGHIGTQNLALVLGTSHKIKVTKDGKYSIEIE